MASFRCVVFLAVLFSSVLANSTILKINVTSSAAPLLLQNSTEHFREEIARVQPVRSNKTENKQTREEEKKFLMSLEKMLPLDKSNREVNSVDEFWRKRNALADSEIEKLLGNDIDLNTKELQANKIILSKKYVEYDKALSTNETYPPSISFFQGKALIEQSDIFKIIKKLPKGAGLYNMIITAVPFNFMYYNLTFQDNLYFRFEDTLRFTFSKTRPAPGWRLLSRLRGTDNPEFVDDLNRAIKDRLTLVVPNSEGSTVASTTFADVIQLYTNLTRYRPNFIKTFKEALKTLYEDNIMYAELGYDFPEVYDLDGTTYNPIEVLRLCNAVLDEFILTHPDFIGVRFLYIPLSVLTSENLPQYRQITTNLWRSNPKLMVGFGAISMGETDQPLSFWVEELLKFPKEINFFFDAGVTNNWGVNSDYDLLDAITLNVAGIGEGIAITKHPLLLEQLRKKGIPIVIFPIMAQSMNFVQDMRTHPASILVATNTPIVIGNAAGTVWNDTGLSYDWYETYMAMTPRFCDLRCLKQFALNSWIYCSLSNEAKKRSIRMWQLQWNNFIDYVIDNYKTVVFKKSIRVY